MIKAGIIGGAGFTAGELIRILLNHPKVAIEFVYSTSNAGNMITEVHQDLTGEIEIRFTNEIHPDVDVLFLCLGHGNSTRFLSENTFGDNVKIIDLSNDFRLTPQAKYKDKDFVYGLPELKKQQIVAARYIANPGCFATAIELALLPLAKAGLLQEEVHVHAITGSTGAGVSLSDTTHFSWRSNNVSVYKAFSHQHLSEINESLQHLQPSWQGELNFIPVRGNFTRGIFASAYIHCELELEEVTPLFHTFYEEEKFTHVSQSPVHLKQVVNTNKCLMHLEKHGNKLLVCSIIDNLLKGASGQAVQNMNLMFGLEESDGLNLKSVAF